MSIDFLLLLWLVGMNPGVTAQEIAAWEAADLVGRTRFAPIELPRGFITVIIGAPFFVYLLYQQRK